MTSPVQSVNSSAHSTIDHAPTNPVDPIIAMDPMTAKLTEAGKFMASSMASSYASVFGDEKKSNPKMYAICATVIGISATAYIISAIISFSLVAAIQVLALGILFAASYTLLNHHLANINTLPSAAEIAIAP